MSPTALLAAIVAILAMTMGARAQALLPGGTGTGALEDIDCGTDCDEYCRVRDECKAKCDRMGHRCQGITMPKNIRRVRM